MGPSTRPAPESRRSSSAAAKVSLAKAVSAYEKALIKNALRVTRGNRVQAAKLLDSTERIISYKVKKYQIDCRRFR